MASVKLIGGYSPKENEHAVGSPSPFVNRVQIALNLKSIDYEFLLETFGSKSELLLKSNPVNKNIPVLIHHNKPICESLIIVQYIDELWTSGPSILPSDPYDRAIKRFWGAYIDDKCFPLLVEILKAKGEEERLAAIDKLVATLVLLEEYFINCSGEGNGNFFGGDSIGYVDIALGCFLGSFKAFEKMFDVKVLDITKMPRLAKWAERFCSDDAVKNVIPEIEKLSDNVGLVVFWLLQWWFAGALVGVWFCFVWLKLNWVECCLGLLYSPKKGVMLFYFWPSSNRILASAEELVCSIWTAGHVGSDLPWTAGHVGSVLLQGCRLPSLLQCPPPKKKRVTMLYIAALNLLVGLLQSVCGQVLMVFDLVLLDFGFVVS
ncbi:hypothetical protein TEA_023445 [Camellia sinensis var. sinensis]|uniref:glutathione transferase n=1 Tax=Camellia sinensis var. sinensis TaxID=542762 RepID=A0A4S4DL16_CAMSN|nr:hypothetical protein TEA_023445 [Camellia sinensis var. sinensis]